MGTQDLDQDHIHQEEEEEAEGRIVDHLYLLEENILETEKYQKKILVLEYLVLVWTQLKENLKGNFLALALLTGCKLC